ncbi:C40 family peptidase [Sphaerisporangium corydalis]|uniref:C40 family peptidase n=1 Tax=Sphaerisporangium corydalis TaxID=1441875 RepID=A0ABV9EEE1_9ACTN|nr:C40 family peptidase [Sphaerisporangium corydalis]
MPSDRSFWITAGNLALVTAVACGGGLALPASAQAAPLTRIAPVTLVTASATTDAASTLAAAAPITRSAMIARAKTWNPHTSKRIPYSQAKTHGGYRTDCSGYVSMALGLAKPGPITVGLAKAAYTKRIKISELRKGDLIIDAIGNNNTRHVVIFEKWANTGHTSYWAYEQRGSYGTDYRTRTYGLSSGSEYKPYRALNIREDAPVPPPTVTRATVIARAKTWKPATAQRVPYSQTAKHDGYRADGSGYVSMTLGLAKPGLLTMDLAASAHSRPIKMTELLQGDLVIDPVGGSTARAVLIFDKWADAGHTSYWAYQQRAGFGTDYRIVKDGLTAGTQFKAYRPTGIR